jgi:hypothetical protein
MNQSFKPVIMFVASKIPVNSTMNVSIVQKKISNTQYANYENEAELEAYVNSLYVPPDSDQYCKIVCQCGLEYNYLKTALPASNVTCTCGRKVIEYGN